MSDADSVWNPCHMPARRSCRRWWLWFVCCVLASAAATLAVPNRIYWSVDPERGDGVATTAENHLRPILFHELHHLVRHTQVERVSLMDMEVKPLAVLNFARAISYEQEGAHLQ